MTNTNQELTLENLPEMLTAELIADYLDVCYVKALQLIKHSGMPHIRLGRSYRVPKARFQEWLDAQQDVS